MPKTRFQKLRKEITHDSQGNKGMCHVSFLLYISKCQQTLRCPLDPEQLMMSPTCPWPGRCTSQSCNQNCFGELRDGKEGWLSLLGKTVCTQPWSWQYICFVGPSVKKSTYDVTQKLMQLIVTMHLGLRMHLLGI